MSIIRKIFTAISILVVSLAVLVFALVKWIFITWPQLTMDEFVYHLTAPLKGTGSNIINRGLLMTLCPTVIVLLILLAVVALFGRKSFYRYIAIAEFVIGVVGITGVLVFAYNKLSVADYLSHSSEDSLFIDTNYVAPDSVKLEFPEEKRNLVYIFLESMEGTFSSVENGGYMEQDVIPELTQLSRDNIDFSGNDKQSNGGLVMPSANWTIAAMFAQTSGLPLKANVGTNEMEKEDSFFHNAITLGDILKDAGYSQTLMIGSDATFGGRRLYFTQHGDFEIIDYPAAKEAGWIPMDYEEWWGFEDEKLFEYAKNRLLQYQESGDPFNLTLLTVDTHFEDGYVCRLCDEESDIQYTNVLSCSSRQVSAFVEWIQQQDFYDNTTIVISGDHLTGDADYLNGIDSDYERKVYTTFILLLNTKMTAIVPIRHLICFRQHWLH